MSVRPMLAGCWPGKDVTRCRCVRVQRKTWKVRLESLERAGVVRNCCCWSQTDGLGACVNCGSKGLLSCGLVVPAGFRIGRTSGSEGGAFARAWQVGTWIFAHRAPVPSNNRHARLSPRRWGDAATAPPVPYHPGDEECPDEWVQVQAPTISGLRPMSPLRLPGERGLAPSVAMSSPTFRFVSAVDERTSTWVSLIT